MVRSSSGLKHLPFTRDATFSLGSLLPGVADRSSMAVTSMTKGMASQLVQSLFGIVWFVYLNLIQLSEAVSAFAAQEPRAAAEIMYVHVS